MERLKENAGVGDLKQNPTWQSSGKREYRVVDRLRGTLVPEQDDEQVFYT